MTDVVGVITKEKANARIIVDVVIPSEHDFIDFKETIPILSGQDVEGLFARRKSLPKGTVFKFAGGDDMRYEVNWGNIESNHGKFQSEFGPQFVRSLKASKIFPAVYLPSSDFTCRFYYSFDGTDHSNHSSSYRHDPNGEARDPVQPEITRDVYKDLGVAKDATAKHIKTAYRKLALVHHPDKGGDPEKFKTVGFAYNLLSNKEERAKYDVARRPMYF